MKILSGKEEEEAIYFLNEASNAALNAKCFKKRRGAVIVSNGEIIGEGWNSPPRDEPVPRCTKDGLPNDFESDPTCCIHAEQKAYMDALRKNPKKISGSSIYYSMISEKGDILPSGKPYCTICSKMALELGIENFILLHEEGITSYDTDEYNKLSFSYK